jgi:hypothetical protein
MLDLDSPRYGLIDIQQNSMLRLEKQVVEGMPQGNLSPSP